MPDVLMPRLSDTMAEGVLSQWRKQEGDTVHRGDVLAEIETDKATMELEAYDDGVLERLLIAAGTTVPIGEPIAVIGDGTGVAATARTPPAAAGQPGTAAPNAAAAATEPTNPAAPTGSLPVATTPPDRRSVRTSPLARAIARDHGIDLATVAGSGPGGRIIRADVEAVVAAAAPAPVEAPAPRPDRPTTAAAARQPDDEEVALTPIRRVTAQRLTASATVPHFSLTGVVDAEPLLALRAESNDQLAATGTKISINDLLVRACAVTLRTHPQVNASWGGDTILRHARINIGIAVALDDGLIVPVLREADRKSVREIAAASQELTDRARAGRLTPTELTGGTFTISNLGMFGVDEFTAVINPPEAAILAVGAAAEEPVIRGGRVIAGTTMKLTLSIDHRVLDGATAATFLRDLTQVLQTPLRILL